MTRREGSGRMKKLTGKRKEKEAEEREENFKNLLTKWR